MHLAIFDIDGTLTDSCAFDDALFAEAVQHVLNVRISNSWGRYKHVTDSGILDELLDLTGFSGCRAEMHAEVKKRFAASVGSHIQRHSVPEIPGARDLLYTLLRHDAVLVAIATGGWRETAELKLRAVAIDPSLIPMATASDAIDRCEILKLAVNRASKGLEADRTTYFGDGEWDKKAASELGFEFIGVGPKVAHHYVVRDLSDHAAIFRHMGI